LLKISHQNGGRKEVLIMEQFKLDNSSPEPPTPFSDKSDFSGGPNFGQPDDWNEPSEGWFSKYGSTVVLPVVAILVLAGGIYLYATQKSAPAALEEQTATNSEEINLIEEGKGATSTKPIAQPAEQPQKIEQIIPASEKKDGSIIEKAVRGNGVTHLARRALKQYITDNPQKGQSLTNEHKIYIEDYLKDKTGSRSLKIGEEVSFTEKTIQEGIDSSKTLTQNQLKNLEKYSANVIW